jgi:hypothetical protein
MNAAAREIAKQRKAGQALVQAFFRTRKHDRNAAGESVDLHWSKQESRAVDFFVPADRQTDLAYLVVRAREAGAPRGSFQTGVYEIQTDAGIWQRADLMRLDTDTPAKAAKAVFKTWAQLEAEDLAAGGCAA